MSKIITQSEVNLLSYWNVLMKHRRMIAVIVGSVSVLAVVTSLLLPKIYKASATIMPVSSSGGGALSSLSSQFGGIAAMAGMNLGGGGADEASKLSVILNSRTLTENVIRAENLMPILFPGEEMSESEVSKESDSDVQFKMELAVLRMKIGRIAVVSDKKNKTLKVSAKFRDPYVASRVVNAYLEMLQNYINDNALTTEKRNRIFIERQLDQNKRKFLEAGKEISEFYKGSRVSTADAVLDVPIRFPSAAMEIGTPASGGESRVTDSDLSILTAEKNDIEKTIARAQVVKDVPQQVYMNYLMLRRELLGKLSAMLATQLEMAKVEEAKEDLSFQVIDKAVPPFKRFSPARGRICMVSFFTALFFAIFLAFFLEYVERMKKLQK
jgi:uncharacterized protein involved in exopolysaccharide biosynthesis